jgi:hypothetical protein
MPEKFPSSEETPAAKVARLLGEASITAGPDGPVVRMEMVAGQGGQREVRGTILEIHNDDQEPYLISKMGSESARRIPLSWIADINRTSL